VFYTVDKRETNNAYEFQHLVVTHSGVRRKLSLGGSFNGRWWSFVFGVRCLWRHHL